MSKRYPGNFITGNPVALTQTSNNGVWDLKDQYHAQNSNTWQEVDGIYEIGRSLRSRYSSTGTLIKNSNLPSPTNTSKWTVSMWVKRGSLAVKTNYYNGLIGKTISSSANFALYFSYSGSNVRDSITWTFTNALYMETRQLFRDTSSWSHFVFVWDSGNAIATERAKIYHNGILITDYIADNRSSITTSMDCWNTTNTGYTGVYFGSSANASTPNSSLDGYATEVHNVDGQCLDPSYFGYFDPITNIWLPKKYTGTWGNAGAYFAFDEINSVTNLGRNRAGSNYFTYSEQFDNGAWSKYQSSVSANATTAPDGTTTADKLVGTTGSSGDHQFSQSNMVTATNNGVYTFSCYAKAAERSNFRLYIQKRDGATYAYSDFNLSTGQIDNTSGPYAGAIPTITFVGNGWYRCTSTVNVGSGAGGVSAIISYSTASGETAGYGLFVWGAQINLGSTADRYIQTGATAALNDWTPYGISLTAGSTYDSMVDSPINVFTSATDVGGTVPGNYPIIDDKEYSQNYITYSDANLSWSQSAAAGFGPQAMTKSTFQLPKTGKWVFAITIGASGNNAQMGIARPDYVGNPTRAQYGSAIVTTDYAVMNPTGGVVKNGTEISTSSSIGVGDELQCAVDCDAGIVSWYRNGTYLGQATGMATTTNDYWPMTFGASSGSGGSGSWNFGQRPFAYAPPAGFKTLNTTNLQALGTSITGKAAITPNKWFDTSLWGGTGAARNVQNSEFQPDLVWLKVRNISDSNGLFDSVRGAGARLQSNDTGAEANTPAVLSSFNSNGFSISGSDQQSNGAGNSYVGWQWKQSPTSGFNIIPYTGDGTSNKAISHNLGVTPGFAIIKSRTNAAGGPSWHIYHKSIAPTSRIYFETLAAGNASGMWGSTGWSSSNFYVGWDGANYGTNYNTSTYIAYLWAEVPGFSKFGSYVGNGSTDGPFVYTGFEPAFVMVKSTANAENWAISDNKRNNIQSGSNPINAFLRPDESSAETTGAMIIDFTSNGFKLRNTDTKSNGSGYNYIYVAFAESPFGLNNRAR
jgi:hypothetical protein